MGRRRSISARSVSESVIFAAVIQSAGDPAATEIAPDEAAIGANAFLPADGVRIPLPEWRPQK